MPNGFMGRLQTVMQGLLPPEHDFFVLFHALIDHAEEAAAILERLLGDFSRLDLAVQEIDQVEHRADHQVHGIVAKLDATFVTPVLFDREDIYHLAETLDDIVDEVKGTIDRFKIFGFTAPDEHMKAMGGLIVRAVRVLHDTVAQLETIRLSSAEFCAAVNALENEGDAGLKRSLAELFRDGADALDVIKRKEIYEFLEKTLDSCEDAANMLENLLVKNA